jgi:hypothetical protein
MSWNKTIYTELDKITEQEFFQRELGVSVVCNISIQELKDSKNLIIASTNPQYWIKFLETRPKGSVVFLLLGNETYEPQIFNALNGLKSLSHVFIYNAPTKIFPSTLAKTLIGHMLDLGRQKFPYPDSVYRDFRNSLHLYRKFRSIRIDYQHSFLPQGYSNNFAYKLSKRLKLESSHSLISLNLQDSFVPTALRPKFLSFSGQATNRRRELVISAAKKYLDEPPDLTEGFRGTSHNGDFTYVDQLRESKFILIPPGSFNNSNHRYTESLLCGAVPVILAKNSLDPSENTNWTNSLAGLTPFSAKLMLRYLSKLNDKEIQLLVLKLRSEDFLRITNFRNKFLNLTSSP